MSKYTFICEKCGHSEQQYTKRNINKVECTECGFDANRQLPTLVDSEIRETIDPYTGVKRTQDQKELLRERKEEYYWTVEVPRLVQKYSLETCLEQDWVWIDDNGELHVHTKPPHKR
jgi:Zn ribbon nucleic-acid-binding protein